MRIRRLLGLVLAVAGAGLLVYALQARFSGVPPVGTLFDPVDGLYRTARGAAGPPDSTRLRIGALDEPVTIVRDQRSVPHIFAESDRDAIIALGYVTAQDRLFQLDFIPRVASGRLSEAFGAQAVANDRFLRQTGMEWGAQKNLDRIRRADGVELDLIQWYGAGVNAYLDGIDRADLPLEFRLLGYRPDRYTPIQALRLLQYMTFDLTYQSDDASYARLKSRLPADEYRRLYPNQPAGLYAPIIPTAEDEAAGGSGRPAAAERASTGDGADAASGVSAPARRHALKALAQRSDVLNRLEGTAMEGFRPGKGSNNWAVDASRSDTGAPILAGDMHLSLSLPPIWYEAHLVTPSMNTYGLTVPGAPILIEAFNEHLGWTFTNTGADQIDHYALEINDDTTAYRFEGEWRPLRRTVDTIRVNRGAPVLDTLYFSHHGPVHFPDRAAGDPVAGAVAERWVAHDTTRTLRALWKMNHADSLEAFERALRDWDTPMQNVLYAGRDGNIAIRSTGYLPIRRAGHGRGLLDGTTDRGAWVGRVPFDELPYSRNPEQGFLASANQKPTGGNYPYYLGHDWRDGWRSLRLDTLLRGRERHGVDDFKRYQADVDVQQRDVFVPLLDTLTGLSGRADSLRAMLQRWDGTAGVDRPEPLVFDVFLDRLHRLAWDEPVFRNVPEPEDAPFLALMRENPQAPWFDIRSTPETETAGQLLAAALEATADTLAARHGWSPSDWRWGDHHRILFRHLSRSDVLRPLWRGPFEYPGFEATLSPARGRQATHSASQRIIVDFSTDPPTGIGVVPGGQSGNPLDPRHYDTQLPAYVNFEYFDLHRPGAPGALPDERVSTTTVLAPDS
jgi:penicillin amidase